MKTVCRIFFVLFALWFCEQATSRFFEKYAVRKHGFLCELQQGDHWLYSTFSWLPFGAWESLPVHKNYSKSERMRESENLYTTNSLHYLRPTCDKLYEALLSGTDNLDELVLEQRNIPAGKMFSSQLQAAEKRGLVLLFIGPDGSSLGVGRENLSHEMAAILRLGVDFAIVRAGNFAQALDAMNLLAGPEWNPERKVAVCAYGKEAGMVAMAMANRDTSLVGAALLSPIGEIPLERWTQRVYPPVLFAARNKDSVLVHHNVLLWTVRCRRASLLNSRRTYGFISRNVVEGNFPDIRLKAIAYAFLVDAIRQSD